MDGTDSAPHLTELQERFIADFRTSRMSRLHVLIGPVGSGKTTVVSEVILQGFRSATYQRALVVAAPLILDQMADLLDRPSLLVPTVRITKSRYRQLEFPGSAAALTWYSDFVGLISAYVLRQPSVLTTIAGVHWSLLAIDDIDALGMASREALSRLAQSSNVDRVLATAVRLAALRTFPSFGEARVTRWNLKDIIARASLNYNRLYTSGGLTR